MKKIELFLILVVAIFMSLTLPIFNKDHVMDFGSTTDWISALSTLGTLIIAYAAFKHAPKWLNQKMDEHALNIAKDLIVKDFPEINNILNASALHIYTFIGSHEYFDIDTSFSDILDLTKEKNNILNTLKLTPKKIESNIQSLVKLGWTLNNTRYQPYIDTIKSHNNCIFALEQIYNNIDRISLYIENNDSEQTKLEIHVNILKRKCNAFIKSHELYSENYVTFINSASTVPEYFDIKSIKIR